MRAGIGEKMSFTLKTQTKGRRDAGVSHDRQMVQGMVKAERKTHDLKHGAHFNPLMRVL